MQQLDREGREPTDEERRILVKYVGWGGIPQVFAESARRNGNAERDRLKALLTPEQYEAARASTLNAHYTSPTVIGGIYEPSSGSGSQAAGCWSPRSGSGTSLA